MAGRSSADKKLSDDEDLDLFGDGSMDHSASGACNSSADEAEDGENAPQPLERQRQAAVARMQRLFGLDTDELPDEPLVQDDSNYQRKMYWTCIQDSGFPHRVNHAVASLE